MSTTRANHLPRISLRAMAWRYVWSRPLVTAATIAGVALGAALITGILAVRAASRQALVAEAAVFDVVVGAPGGRMQLVLSSVYHLDAPTGNVPWRELERWRADSRVSTRRCSPRANRRRPALRHCWNWRGGGTSGSPSRR
jgi:hypothetical protein